MFDHMTFRVRSLAATPALCEATMARGGRDNGPPGLRPHDHPDCCGAFVPDPDGNDVEAVCHGAA